MCSHCISCHCYSFYCVVDYVSSFAVVVFIENIALTSCFVVTLSVILICVWLFIAFR